jgi:hypothetical protein
MNISELKTKEVHAEDVKRGDILIMEVGRSSTSEGTRTKFEVLSVTDIDENTVSITMQRTIGGRLKDGPCTGKYGKLVKLEKTIS